MNIYSRRKWMLALVALGITEVTQAQLATPYLSSNRSHINPAGAVFRETGNIRYGSSNTDSFSKQVVGFSGVGETAGFEVDFLVDETIKSGESENSKNGVDLRGAFSAGSLAIGVGSGNYNGDVTEKTLDIGAGIKTSLLFENTYIGLLRRDAEGEYDAFGWGLGAISGNPTDLQWKAEIANLNASDENYTKSFQVFEVKTNEMLFYLEQESGQGYDQQLLGLGWEHSDSWAFGLGLFNRDSESGFQFTIGYNYKNVSRLSNGGSQPQQQQQEPPPEEQAQ